MTMFYLSKISCLQPFLILFIILSIINIHIVYSTQITISESRYHDDDNGTDVNHSTASIMINDSNVNLNCMMETENASSSIDQLAKKPVIETKVVGGNYAKSGQFPYQAAFQVKEKVICGGIVYNESFVLTAAHCLYRTKSDMHSVGDCLVLVGGLELNSTEMQKYKLRKFVKYPKYVRTKHKFDIAWLIVDGVIKFSDVVKPISIAHKRYRIGTKCVVSGWGRTKFKGEQSVKLKYTSAEIVDDFKCIRRYDRPLRGMICAQQMDTGPCQGDSGGPFVCYQELVGIVSFGVGCATDQYPDVYTDTWHYRYWIWFNGAETITVHRWLIQWVLVVTLFM